VARILNDQFTVPADETPEYSDWATIGSATSVDFGVTITNDQSPDLWVQWTDDVNGPEPEDIDVPLLPAADPNGNHAYVKADDVPVDGAYVRYKGIAYGTEAVCYATIDTN
jgi:hypothetical protein